MNKHVKGNALPIVLVMLLVLTIVGISGMKMAQSQMKMVGIEQFQAIALEAAESAVSSHFEQAVFRDGEVNDVTAGTDVSLGTDVAGTPRHLYKGSGPVPSGGYSRANNTFAAYHFEIEARGTAPKNSRANVVQGVYLVARGQ